MCDGGRRAGGRMAAGVFEHGRLLLLRAQAFIVSFFFEGGWVVCGGAASVGPGCALPEGEEVCSRPRRAFYVLGVLFFGC